jgi:hypothetical protein
MKNNKFLLIAIISTSFIFADTQVSAQTGINAFWKQFKAAIINKNKNTAASLSRLPIEMPYGVKSVKTNSEFSRRYDEIFNGEADATKCFMKSPLQKVSAKRYEVNCGFKADVNGGEPIVYRFELTKTGWKFVGLDNINE